MPGIKMTELAVKLMAEGYICNNCLGRQVAQLLSGMDNRERGRVVRTFLAMECDTENCRNVDAENFAGIRFHLNKSLNKKVPEKAKRSCYLCDGLFEKLEEVVENVVRELENYEYSSFLVGIKLPEYLENRELEVWSWVGNEYAESLRNELSREVGRRIQNMTGKEVDFKNPDITVILNLQRNVVELVISSLYIYGKYNKYREMPQAKWICTNCNGIGCKKCDWKGKMYEDSVEERIGRVLLEMAEGTDTSFHGAGREDVDALCTGWREFVIEIKEPRKRDLDLKTAEKKINRINKAAVEVKDLRFVDKGFVRTLKAKRTHKIYDVLVEVDGKIDRSRLRSIVGREFRIEQRTPKRVVHRRSDKIRRRKVRVQDVKLMRDGRLLMKLKTEAGTYVKEFVSGDEGRTSPSIAELLGVNARVEKLTVVGFEERW